MKPDRIPSTIVTHTETTHTVLCDFMKDDSRAPINLNDNEFFIRRVHGSSGNVNIVIVAGPDRIRLHDYHAFLLHEALGQILRKAEYGEAEMLKDVEKNRERVERHKRMRREFIFSP